MPAALRDTAQINPGLTSGTADCSFTVPSSVQAGDVMVIEVGGNNASATWTTAATLRQNPTSGSGNGSYVFTKTVAAGEPGNSFGLTASTSRRWVGVAAFFSGVTETGLLSSSASSPTASTSITLPTVGGVPAGAMVVGTLDARTSSGSTATLTPPSGYTEAVEAGTAFADSPNYAHAVVYKTAPSAGTYGGESAAASESTALHMTALVVLPATGGQSFTGAAALSGSGSLSTAAPSTRAAALSGSGTLAAAAVPGGTKAAALSGSGALAAGATGPVAQLTGSGTLTAARAGSLLVGLSGSGALTAVAVAYVYEPGPAPLWLSPPAETVYLAETVTGKIWQQLDGVRGSYGDGLNNEGVTGRFSVPASRGLRALLVQPWRTMVVVAQGDKVLGMYPVPDGDRSVGGDVEVNGASVYSLLALRPAWTTAADPPSQLADLKVRGSLAQMAAAIIGNALGWGPLPIAVPAGLPGGGWERNYPSYELHDAASRLLELTDDQGGRLDVHFNPRWVGGRHDRVEWEVRLGEPLAGPAVPWRWDSRADHTVRITEQWGGGEIATTAWLAGEGQERARLIRRASSPTLLASGWPELHRIDGSTYGSVTDGTTLSAYAAAEVEVGLKRSGQVAYVVRADLEPTIAQWQLGERVFFDVADDQWMDDGRYAGQLAQWSKGLGSTQVALVLSGQEKVA